MARFRSRLSAIFDLRSHRHICFAVARLFRLAFICLQSSVGASCSGRISRHTWHLVGGYYSTRLPQGMSHFCCTLPQGSHWSTYFSVLFDSYLCQTHRQMTATPNHALQRTATAVTARASAAAFPPAMHGPRQPPPSLSLGSLGVFNIYR